MRISNTRKSQHGYSMIELLVAMSLAGVALTVSAKDFTYTVHQRIDMEKIAEAQHGVSAALTFVTQELRQAGACLPTLGKFVALDGEDNGDQDTLTLRVGVTDQDTIVCVRTVTTAIARSGESSMVVQHPEGFNAGQWIYMTSLGDGEMFRVASVDGAVLTVEGTFGTDYRASSGVYAIEERSYAIDSAGGVNVLTVAIDGGDPQPMVKGIDVFNVRYHLHMGEDFTLVDEPADSSEWRMVREVELTVSAQTVKSMQAGQMHVVEQSSNIKPRNFL